MNQITCDKCNGSGKMLLGEDNKLTTCTKCSGTGAFVIREDASGKSTVTKRLQEG